MMASAADLHHAHFRRGLALFATVFTILRRRAPADLSRTLFLVLFVRHLNLPPDYALLLPASLLRHDHAPVLAARRA